MSNGTRMFRLGKAKAADAIVVAESGNRKTGCIAVTYTAESTCPKDCPLYDSKCYAERGRVRLTWNRTALSTPDASAKAEVAGLKRLPPETIVRLHVAGDFANTKHARMVADVVKENRLRAFAYIHRAITKMGAIKRNAFGTISVFGSVTVEQIPECINKGFNPAVVVDDFPNGNKAFMLNGAKMIPCLKQAGTRTSCNDCLVCLRATGENPTWGIAFKKH